MASNAQLAAIFERMAQLIDLLEDNTFKAVAFRRCARALADRSEPVADLVNRENPKDVKALCGVEGIGQGLAARIAEYVTTGKIREYDDMLAQVPQTLLPLFDVPGLGPKTLAMLWKQAGVNSADDLRQKIDSGELAAMKIKGLGEKKIQNIRKSLTFVETTGTARVRIGDARPLAIALVEQLRKVKGVEQVEFAGSLRRGRETIGDIDLICAVSEKNAGAVSDAFVKLTSGAEVLAKGPTKTSVRLESGLQVDLRIVQPDQYGAALLYFTGSKEHNVALRGRAIDMGYKLNEYALSDASGKAVAGKTEAEIYRKLKLDWVPPELREDRGEIALAARHKLPELIGFDDVKAELHAHTTASDGAWSIQELVEAALARGFHTVAITDHSKSQVIARGLTEDRLEKHIADVRAVAAKYKNRINVLAGSEVDILVDGRLDYPDSLLKQLDIVVASPHASLSQDPEKATARLLKAVENPYVTILGHATGRLVLRREGLSPDMSALVKACAQRGIAMEINANHYRLDLRDAHARMALDAGAKLAINTDAHGPADLDELVYGILTARRAGARCDDVVNCLSRESLAKWIKGTRG